jgi:hypothetical protein
MARAYAASQRQGASVPMLRQLGTEDITATHISLAVSRRTTDQQLVIGESTNEQLPLDHLANGYEQTVLASALSEARSPAEYDPSSREDNTTELFSVEPSEIGRQHDDVFRSGEQEAAISVLGHRRAIASNGPSTTRSSSDTAGTARLTITESRAWLSSPRANLITLGVSGVTLIVVLANGRAKPDPIAHEATLSPKAVAAPGIVDDVNMLSSPYSNTSVPTFSLRNPPALTSSLPASNFPTQASAMVVPDGSSKVGNDAHADRDRREMWLVGLVFGTDSHRSAMAAAPIKRLKDGYEVRFRTGLEFRCELEFDDLGNPKLLSDCKSETEGPVSPRRISLTCVEDIHGHAVDCGGYYSKSDGYNEFQLYRRIGEWEASQKLQQAVRLHNYSSQK